MAQQLAAGDDVTKVRKAFMKVTKGEDLRKDALIMHARDIKWEEFLEPAPLSVALLGQLLLIAGKKDFTLAQNPPQNGFQLLKYPNSFRSSLVQVSNEGWTAFNEAHTNMDQIRLHTQNVPGHLKAAVKIITTGTDADIAYLLEEPLNSIQYVADECLDLAKATESKFVGVVELIGELIEACTNARGQYEEDIKQRTIALEIATECKQQAEQQTEMAKKHLEKIQKDVDREHEAYRDTISGGAGFIHGVNTLIGGVAKAATSILHPLSSMVQLKVQHESVPDDQSQDKRGIKQAIYVHAETLKQQVESLSDLTKGKEDSKFRDKVIKVDVITGNIKKKIEKIAESAEKEIALDICEQMIEVVQTLRKSDSAMISDHSGLCAALQDDMKELTEKSKALYAQSCAANGVPMGSTPRMSKNPEAQSAGMDEYNLRLNMQCEMLKHQQNRYDAAFDRFSDSSQKITEAMLEISKCNIEVIDFKEIRDVLMKGIKALAEVREEWGKMVRFFQYISNLIKCTLNTSLKTVTGTIKKGQEMKRDGVKLSDCLVDQIYTNTFEAAKVAYVVNNVAGMYVDVSDRYLMDRVASLGKLVALDPEKEQHQMQIKFVELTTDCTETQKHIRKLVREKQIEFKKAVEGRIQQLETELRPVMASVPDAVDAQNKELAKAAIKKEEEDNDMEQFG